MLAIKVGWCWRSKWAGVGDQSGLVLAIKVGWCWRSKWAVVGDQSGLVLAFIILSLG